MAEEGDTTDVKILSPGEVFWFQRWRRTVDWSIGRLSRVRVNGEISPVRIVFPQGSVILAALLLLILNDLSDASNAHTFDVIH